MGSEHIDSFAYDFSFATGTDVGTARQSNQDEVIVCADWGLFAVSDGMGGLTDGGNASKYVRKSIPAMMPFVQSQADDPHSAGLALAQMVGMVSDQLFSAANSAAHIGFGATFCGVWLFQQHAVFANLGDSRAYILRRSGLGLENSGDQGFTQVTTDHNIAAVLIQRGELTAEEVRGHAVSSRLTRFVGMEPPAAADSYVCEVAPGDVIVLCTDGLYAMVSDDELRVAVAQTEDLQDLVERLVAKANETGGKDNISVVCIKII